MTSREIDEQIAVKIMGYTCSDGGMWDAPSGCPVCGVNPGDIPSFSTRISHAWQVVEKMCSNDDRKFELERLTSRPARGRWWAYFYCGLDRHSGFASDAPMAICLAALKSAEGAAKNE